MAVADPGGGGGPGGPDPPFGPRCRLFNIGPKLGPPPLFLLVDLRWTLVADPGCRGGSRIFERGGGGSRRRYRIFHKHPPPWTLSA